MSFLTEDPDTVNTMYLEDLRETLAQIREDARNDKFPSRYVEPFGAVWRDYPQPDVRSKLDDIWAQRYDHPKD